MGVNVPVSIARELDIKVDDGLPNTGVLRMTVPALAAGGGTTFDGVSFVSNVATCTTTAAAAAAGNAAGTGANTDIFDVFDDFQDSQFQINAFIFGIFQKNRPLSPVKLPPPRFCVYFFRKF